MHGVVNLVFCALTRLDMEHIIEAGVQVANRAYREGLANPLEQAGY
jgi:hypothetical protein